MLDSLSRGKFLCLNYQVLLFFVLGTPSFHLTANLFLSACTTSPNSLVVLLTIPSIVKVYVVVNRFLFVFYGILKQAYCFQHLKAS